MKSENSQRSTAVFRNITMYQTNKTKHQTLLSFFQNKTNQKTIMNQIQHFFDSKNFNHVNSIQNCTKND